MIDYFFSASREEMENRIGIRMEEASVANAGQGSVWVCWWLSAERSIRTHHVSN
jgi:hypothetical protein